MKTRSRFLIAAVLILTAVAAAAAGYALLRQTDSSGGPPPFQGTLGAFTATDPPAPIEDFSFVSGDGRRLRLADLSGKVLLVNLWATWCAPCVREMPALDRLQAAMGGAHFEVVALQTMDPKGIGAVAPFYARIGAEALTIYADPDDMAPRIFGIPGLPVTILLDAAGRERGRLLGSADWDSAEAQALIRYYLVENARQGGVDAGTSGTVR